MRNLTSLLERFAKILNKDSALKETISQVINERTGLTLPHENILLKEGVLELNASAVAKNEIRLKEDAIKAQLKEVFKINIIRVLYK